MEKRFLLPINIFRRTIAEQFLWTNAQYRKFVIVSHGRSGSTYFRSLLNSHPAIRCYGELFNPVPKKTFFHPEHFPLNIRETPAYLENLRRTKSVDFLSDYIWRKYPSGRKAIGFKLFYYHAKEGPWSNLWEFIYNDPTIRIIHLHRKNRLKTFLSLEMAKKYDKWHSNVKDPEPIHLEIERCRLFFEEFQSYEDDIDEKFKNHKSIKFYYEDLVAHREYVMNSVLDLLSVENRPHSSPMKKLKKKNLNEAISNFSSLQRAFKGSPWEKYFNIV